MLACEFDILLDPSILRLKNVILAKQMPESHRKFAIGIAKIQINFFLMFVESSDSRSNCFNDGPDAELKLYFPRSVSNMNVVA